VKVSEKSQWEESTN